MRPIKSLFTVCALLIAAALTAVPGAAVASDALLTISVSKDLAGGASVPPIVIDEQRLMSMPHQVVKTTTPWTDGLVSFDGVPLADLLALSDKKSITLKAIALNDYAVDVPSSDASISGVIVAYRMNGAPMSVRNNGPLWLIYPLSDRPDLDNESTHAKMIWQLKTIELH